MYWYFAGHTIPTLSFEQNRIIHICQQEAEQQAQCPPWELLLYQRCMRSHQQYWNRWMRQDQFWQNIREQLQHGPPPPPLLPLHEPPHVGLGRIDLDDLLSFYRLPFITFLWDTWSYTTVKVFKNHWERLDWLSQQLHTCISTHVPILCWTYSPDFLILQIPIFLRYKFQLPMSLFSTYVVPIPYDTETYLGQCK